jgi:hypothetical protein
MWRRSSPRSCTSNAYTKFQLVALKVATFKKVGSNRRNGSNFGAEWLGIMDRRLPESRRPFDQSRSYDAGEYATRPRPSLQYGFSDTRQLQSAANLFTLSSDIAGGWTGFSGEFSMGSEREQQSHKSTNHRVHDNRK